jgi:DNA-binding MarR family transcriptional regulator
MLAPDRKVTKRTTYDYAERSPGFLLWQLAHLWQRQVVSLLKPVGLTHVQFILLSGLKQLAAKRQVSITQVQLADYARTDIMMTSKVLRKLEERGLVERKGHPDDTRARALALTAEGDALLKKAAKLIDAHDEAFFALAHQTPAAMADLLQQCIERNQND